VAGLIVLVLILIFGVRAATKEKMDSMNLHAPHIQRVDVKTTTTATSTTTISTPAPSAPCADSFVREAKGRGDHRDEILDYFDNSPTPNCFSEWLYVPSEWHRWQQEFTDGKDCQVWYWVFGSAQPVGPYYSYNLPDIPKGPPTKWRISTTCTLRTFQTG
jgi:hypothetical protein